MKTGDSVHQKKPIIGILAWAFLLSPVAAADWPQLQGPDRNAISKETGLLKEWPKDGPPLAWKTTALGGGDSAPSIAAGRISVTPIHLDLTNHRLLDQLRGWDLATVLGGPV